MIALGRWAGHGRVLFRSEVRMTTRRKPIFARNKRNVSQPHWLWVALSLCVLIAVTLLDVGQSHHSWATTTPTSLSRSRSPKSKRSSRLQVRILRFGEPARRPATDLLAPPVGTIGREHNAVSISTRPARRLRREVLSAPRGLLAAQGGCIAQDRSDCAAQRKCSPRSVWGNRADRLVPDGRTGQDGARSDTVRERGLEDLGSS